MTKIIPLSSANNQNLSKLITILFSQIGDENSTNEDIRNFTTCLQKIICNRKNTGSILKNLVDENFRIKNTKKDIDDDNICYLMKIKNYVGLFNLVVYELDNKSKEFISSRLGVIIKKEGQLENIFESSVLTWFKVGVDRK